MFGRIGFWRVYVLRTEETLSYRKSEKKRRKYLYISSHKSLGIVVHYKELLSWATHFHFPHPAKPASASSPSLQRSNFQSLFVFLYIFFTPKKRSKIYKGTMYNSLETLIQTIIHHADARKWRKWGYIGRKIERYVFSTCGGAKLRKIMVHMRKTLLDRALVIDSR